MVVVYKCLEDVNFVSFVIELSSMKIIIYCYYHFFVFFILLYIPSIILVYEDYLHYM